MENQRMLTQVDVASTSSSGPAQGCDYYLPPGYRFVPTEEELIADYLARKDKGQQIAVKEMHEVDLYKFSPRYLTEHYAELGNKEWYFFTSRDRKYPNGNRPRRSVEEIGFWKATGADKGIYSNSTGELIGKKKVLVFYNGKPKSSEEQKTNWIMHEYKLNKPSRKPGGNDMKLDNFVLCQVHEQSGKSTKKRKRVTQCCVARTKKGHGKITMPPTSLAEEQECAPTDKGMAPLTALAEKQECPNDDQVDGNIIMAPPLLTGASQEAAPIDYSHQFPGSYGYQDRMCDHLASMYMAETGTWNSLHDSMGETSYGQNNNINYGVPYIDPQMTYPFNVQQQQWPPILQQDSWAMMTQQDSWGMTTQNHGGNSFEQDFSNFINSYNTNFPEPEHGFAGPGGQGDGNPSMGGQGDRTTGMGGQGDVTARRMVR